MKTLKYILLSAFALLTCSCNEVDFLTESPADATYADNLFVDYNGFVLGKNALLAFPRQERQDMIQSAELGCIWKIGTDTGWAETELSWSRGLNQYIEQDLTPEMQFLNGDTDGNPGIFLILYSCISSANMLINRAADADVDWSGGPYSDELSNKNEILAHAYLLRAWAYRHLIMTFGPVPLSLDEIDGLTYRDDWERDSVEDIQDVIEEDLIFASQWLPEDASDVTRLSRVIAFHYLADLYLWQGRHSEAEAAALQVVNNSNFALITSRYGVDINEDGCAFMDQFTNGNIMPEEGNTEGLWIFPNSDVDDLLGAYSNSMRRSWVTAYYNHDVPYLPEYGGRGIGRCAITPWVFTIYEDQDDRISEHAIRKSYTKTDGSTLTCYLTEAQMSTWNNRWASTRKWDWTYDDESRWSASYSYADQTYLRLADTYLLLAEALFKQGKTSEVNGAAYWINKVRTRSNATAISASDVSLEFILDERARELVTEECRRETLYRTGTLLDRTRAHNPWASGEKGGGAGIQSFHVLLPFPQTIIDTNVGNVLEQNEGY